MEVFAPWKLANTINERVYFFSGKSVAQYLPAHTLSVMKSPWLSPSSSGTVPHHHPVCLYQEQTSCYSCCGNLSMESQTEHHVSWKRQALDSEEREKKWLPFPGTSQVTSELNTPRNGKTAHLLTSYLFTDPHTDNTTLRHSHGHAYGR